VLIQNSRLIKLVETYPRLKNTIRVVDGRPKFSLLESFELPLNEIEYQSDEQWRSLLDSELNVHFNDEGLPLWRVILLKGNQRGQIIFIFHPSLADAISGIELMNCLYEMISNPNSNQGEIASLGSSIPSLKQLYKGKQIKSLYISPTAKSLVRNHSSHTIFTKYIFEEAITTQILKWSHIHHLELQYTLFAAFLKAIAALKKQDLEGLKTATAITVLDYRPFFEEPVSKEQLSPLGLWLNGKFNLVDREFPALAREIQEDFHHRLENGEHHDRIKKLFQIPFRFISPEKFLHYCQLPPFVYGLSYVEPVNFNGIYPNDLSMEEIFFISNIDPYCSSINNGCLGVVSFKGKIFLTLWSFDSENNAASILQKMETILNEALHS
jgi:hypothetical protein